MRGIQPTLKSFKGAIKGGWDHMLRLSSWWKGSARGKWGVRARSTRGTTWCMSRIYEGVLHVEEEALGVICCICAEWDFVGEVCGDLG